MLKDLSTPCGGRPPIAAMLVRTIYKLRSMGAVNFDEVTKGN